MTRIFAVLTLLLAGCAPVVVQTGGPQTVRPQQTSRTATAAEVQRRLDSFSGVVRRVEPVAESTCRARNPRMNCDFRIVVDQSRNAPPNAYQTVENGRPVLIFTLPLIVDAQNSDELAFIMGHEAAHHIRGHIPRAQATATAGAAIGAILATVVGADTSGVDTAGQLGGFVGSRRFSKDFELQADSLGAQIAQRAGFNPIRGAEYFTRIPDPGNRFLGSHPPNADRMDAVRRSVGR
ncbi:M48 family metalloprotease [Rhodobacteraceae bacterium 2CG4]|uniref:M48 family metalloprotease n=1 Tax=Halovulum marinum TaxID=2662447 RepID=A0A6L5YVU4_9RHOB|nr:M48 family metallopeptidase [Halovulum marinum]MSU88368.1 M48 family metalloprotease [Halovulum marinum]